MWSRGGRVHCSTGLTSWNPTFAALQKGGPLPRHCSKSSYSHELGLHQKADRHFGHHQPGDGGGAGRFHLLRFPVPARRYLAGRPGAAGIVPHPDRGTGTDGARAIRGDPTRLKSDIPVRAGAQRRVIISTVTLCSRPAYQVVLFSATQEKVHAFFQRIHLAVRPVRNAHRGRRCHCLLLPEPELLETHVQVDRGAGTLPAVMCWPRPLPEARIPVRTAPNREFPLRGPPPTSTEALAGPDQHRRGKYLLTLFGQEAFQRQAGHQDKSPEFDDILAGLIWAARSPQVHDP